MRYAEFIKKVQDRTGIENMEQVALVTHSILSTLGERITRTERKELAAQLPRELKDFLLTDKEPDYFPLYEFYNRVTLRANIGFPHMLKIIQAVMATLQEAVSTGELSDILHELPADYAKLFGMKPGEV